MPTTDRQNRLLIAEDWKRIYQSFKNADFKSYDFDNLRRTMVGYLRQNYPEDFNDYIESSEYLALIDLIAFLGQNIAFRVDLNARENYIELAERRESVLRLARLLSYNPKRNRAANGFLKIDSVSTTETIYDSNGFNLKDQTVAWNDPSNENWEEQFRKILNAALPVNNIVGKPITSDTVAGVLTQSYKFNAINQNTPTYSFSKTVNGESTKFEVTSCRIKEGNIIEEPPLPGNSLGFLYREDGQGNASSNTGYFVHFRQGQLQTGDFTVTAPSANQIISIDSANINNSDIWLYKLNSIGTENALWTKVDSTIGTNVTYNSINKNKRNIFAVQTRQDDKINLVFADGVFGNLPKGSFRVYYRQSANRQYTIRPADISNTVVSIKYVSSVGKIETINITLSLKYNVDNASISESNTSIRNSAPQTYYTQNRMITAEDYQIGPLNVSQEIIKAKTVNRIASGISRNFDLKDPTAKYSSTNLYSQDGVIYQDSFTKKYQFSFVTQTDIEGNIENLIQPLLSTRGINSFYHYNYSRIITDDLQASFVQSTADTNLSTGYLQDTNGTRFQVGTFTGGALRFVESGALVKFVAPTGQHFMVDSDKYTLMSGSADHPNSVDYFWVKVIGVNGNGTEVDSSGNGPIKFNKQVPEGAIVKEIRPKLTRTLSTDVKTQLVDQIFAYKTFGLRYDQNLREWRVIIKENLNSLGEFNLGKTGDTSSAELDSSWLLLFETNGETYTITYRGLRYLFESDQDVNFYFDNTKKIFNNKTGKLIKDKIGILSINTQPDSVVPFTVDTVWEITDQYIDIDGYVNTKKIEVGFYDENNDGIIDDPDIFENLVAPQTNSSSKYIFQKKIQSNQGSEIFVYDNANSVRVVPNESSIGAYSQYDDGQVFYIEDTKTFKAISGSLLVIESGYQAFVGRGNLKFQYVHSADENSRLDSAASNIMDTYLLTRQYDRSFRQYLKGAVSAMPKPPSSDELYLLYSEDINKIKSISDEVIYHPVSYKVLFGEKADPDVQATFKVVKNPDQVVNDNEIKTRVIAAINEFFSLDNWDFGDTFSFTELATYVMTATAPSISNFVIVPKQQSQVFGSLYEIKSEDFEIFISGATVDNVEIIDSITATNIQAAGGTVVSSVQSTTTGNTVSSNLNTGSTSSNGGSSY